MNSLSAHISKVFFVFLVVFGGISFLNAAEVKAQAGCRYDSECPNTCPCPGGSAWCDSGGNCRNTCEDTCVNTVTGSSCGCAVGAWGPWSACNGGFQTRDCTTYNPPSCGSGIYQIAVCSTPTGPGGPGNTNTPGPTAPPVCTITSAVLSPANASINVGDNVSFALTVTDSPSGCAQDANFSASNGNISIISANPDAAEPFTVSVQCNVAGSANLSGQARQGGVSQASDTSIVTCTALPTAIATLSPAPGQCSATSLSGSGACSGSNLNLNYSWGAAAGASTYRWQLSTSPSFSSLLLDSTGAGTGFSSTRPGGTYYARQRVETAGSCAAPSAWSNVTTVSNTCGVIATPPPIGTTFTPTPKPPTATPAPPPVNINLTPVTLNGSGSMGVGVVSGGPLCASCGASFVISGPGGVATVVANDPAAAYQTIVTATAIGITQYTVVTTDANGNVVTATGQITVTNPQPWFQSNGGDIVACKAIT